MGFPLGRRYTRLRGGVSPEPGVRPVTDGDRLTEPELQGIALPVAYVGVDDVPIQFANQFVVQIEEEEILLVVGQMSPPVLIGTPAQQAEQAKGVPFVPIQVVARYGMTVHRARQLAELLSRQIKRFEEAQEARQHAE